MLLYVIHTRGSLIYDGRLKGKGTRLQRPAGPQAPGSCEGVDALLDPSGPAEHKRALPLHLAALPYPPRHMESRTPASHTRTDVAVNSAA